MIEDNERLFDIASPIVKTAGYELISSSFYKPKEFQASWKRKGNVVDLKVSDYLIDAPDDVLESFIETVIQTVQGKKPVYERTYLDWVTSDDFINEKRKIYVRRSKNLTRTTTGDHKDLLDSLDRLLDAGLLTSEHIDNSFFSWTRSLNTRKVGFCSPMMRVVGISSIMDDPTVPDLVLDYVVYHESLHLEQGYQPGKRAHDSAFRQKERRFPRYDEAENYLKRLKK